MTTALDIINRAARKAGVLGTGQALGAEDINDALADLNDLIAQWQRQRWLIYHLVDVSMVSTGAQSYSAALGGDFNVPRPDRVEAAFVRQLVTNQTNKVDYPMQILEAREDYNRIRLKSLTTGGPAYCLFYDAAYPTGYVYPWPIPQASLYEIHLSLKDTLSDFPSQATSVNLPAEYYMALWSNLALILRASYGLPPVPDAPGSITAMAKSSLNVIRGANTQIPRLRMPTAVRNTGFAYNIYSDLP